VTVATAQLQNTEVWVTLSKASVGHFQEAPKTEDLIERLASIKGLRGPLVVGRGFWRAATVF
jgi:hypothetical protein